jgi:hypothetical protein
VVPLSFFTGTQSEVLFANGFAYPIANAASGAAQLLITGASGKYQQPYFQGGFFQQGRTGQVAKAEFTISLAGQGSATTAIFTAGLATAANSSGSTLVAANAITCTSFASGIVHGEVLISCFGAGYGTSSVSTNLQSTMDLRFNNGATAQPSSTGGGVALGGPTALQTIDFSVNQWFYLTVTFSTSNASNTATLQQLVLYGLN